MCKFNLIDALLDLHLYFIVEDIFLHLDCQSLTNAERASPEKWSQFIQSSQKLYRKKVAAITGWWFVSSNHDHQKKKALGTTTTATFWKPLQQSEADNEE